MFSTLSHKGNANQNDIEIPLTPVINKRPKTINAGKDAGWKCK
jgi:hypothetical protein